MAAVFRALLSILVFSGPTSFAARAAAPKPAPIVMQMTVGDSDAQRRAFLQIAKVLEDIGLRKVRIEVVAYEGGITALLSDNQDTATLLAALARQGVNIEPVRHPLRRAVHLERRLK